MLIRKLEKCDASVLRDCRLSSLKESPESFLVAYHEVAETPLSQVEAELFDQNICYVGAFDGEQLVGFMRFVRFHREARLHVAEVRSVYVKRAVRGQKIGSRLLIKLVDVAKSTGIRSLIISVMADNLAARRLYESCGFQLYGIEPKAINKGDCYVDQALYSLDVAAA